VRKVQVVVKRILEGGTCPLGIKVGDRFDFFSGELAARCHWAHNCMYPVACVLRYGGAVDWAIDKDRVQFCCPDPANPVVFELVRMGQES